MSALAEWWRSHPLERAALIAAVIIAIAALYGMSNHQSSDSTSKPTAGPESQAAQPATQQQQSAAPAFPNPTASATPAAAPANLSAAKDTAGRFLEVYASDRYDDTPIALRGRLRPLVTDRYDAEFAQGSSAAVARELRAARHEVVTANVSQLEPISVSAERVQFNGLVAQHITNDGGQADTSMSVAVTVVPTSDGWRVDEVQV